MYQIGQKVFILGDLEKNELKEKSTPTNWKKYIAFAFGGGSKHEVPGVKIIVGGAVLTPEYAKQIGADYYAKDAAESARIAEEVFGQ